MKSVYLTKAGQSIFYTDNSILTGLDQNELSQIIMQMEAKGLKTTYDNEVDGFLGMEMDQKEGGSIHLPNLIASIYEDLHLDRPTTMSKSTPALVTVPLCIIN